METFGNPPSSFTKPVTASWKRGNPAERTIAHGAYFSPPPAARRRKQITSSNAYLYHKLCETGAVDAFALVPGPRLTAPLTGESSLVPAINVGYGS
jgi:hypothetical protein